MNFFVKAVWDEHESGRGRRSIRDMDIAPKRPRDLLTKKISVPCYRSCGVAHTANRILKDAGY